MPSSFVNVMVSAALAFASCEALAVSAPAVAAPAGASALFSAYIDGLVASSKQLARMLGGVRDKATADFVAPELKRIKENVEARHREIRRLLGARPGLWEQYQAVLQGKQEELGQAEAEFCREAERVITAVPGSPCYGSSDLAEVLLNSAEKAGKDDEGDSLRWN